MTVWDWVAGVFGAFGCVLVLIIFGGYLADVRDHRRRERNRLQKTIKQLEHVADIGFGPDELLLPWVQSQRPCLFLCAPQSDREWKRTGRKHP